MKSLKILTGLIMTLFGCSKDKDNTQSYQNPVDGKVYEADWESYTPETAVKAEEGQVFNKGVRLLSTQDDFSKNINVTELSNYIKKIEEQLIEVRKIKIETGEIMLQVELSKTTQPKFSLAHQGDLTQDFLQQFHDKINKLKDYRTLIDKVSFQIEFSVKGNS